MSSSGGIPGVSPVVWLRDQMAALAAAVRFHFPQWSADWTPTQVRVHVSDSDDLVIPRPQPVGHADPWDGWRRDGAVL